MGKNSVRAYPSVRALRSMRRLTGIQEYDGWGKTDLHCTLRTSRQTATCIQICDVSCCAPVAALGEQTNWLRSRLGVMLTGSSWDPASPGRTKTKMPVEREENTQKDREKHQFTVLLLLLLTSFAFTGANKLLPSSLCPPSLPVQHWSSDCLPSSLILWYLHFIPFTLSLHLFLLLSIPSVQLYSYLWLYFLYLAAGQHQHTQGPQSSEGLRANLAQIVSSQLQQPCAVWDTPGNMLEP